MKNRHGLTLFDSIRQWRWWVVLFYIAVPGAIIEIPRAILLVMGYLLSLGGRLLYWLGDDLGHDLSCWLSKNIGIPSMRKWWIKAAQKQKEKRKSNEGA